MNEQTTKINTDTENKLMVSIRGDWAKKVRGVKVYKLWL